MRLQNHLHLVIFIVFDVQHLSVFFLSTFFLLFFFLLFCFRNQMGNLLKVLTCTELDQGPNFFLDFESEQSFCLAWCLSLFPATNILQVPLSELSLQMCSQQQNRASQCFCMCKCFVQMSLIGRVLSVLRGMFNSKNLNCKYKNI